MNWSEFFLFLLNWDWFDLIRAIYSSVSCPNFCCHSCTTLNKVAWIRVGKISKHEVYNMKELRKSKKWHETLKCSNQYKETQNQLKQIRVLFSTYKTLFESIGIVCNYATTNVLLTNSCLEFSTLVHYIKEVLETFIWYQYRCFQ